MFTRRFSLSFGIVLLLLNGCVIFGVGHGYFTVSGELRSSEGQEIENCFVQLNEMVALIKPKKIGGKFSIGFIVEPKSRQYSLSIECSNYETFKKIIIYEAQNNLIELGEIIFNEKDKT